MALPGAEAPLSDLDLLRGDVLADPWAHGLGPDEAAEFLEGLSEGRFASVLYRGRTGRTLIQPRGGLPLVEQQRALAVALSDAGADLIPLTIDSHTRHNGYGRARELLALSGGAGGDRLNGYPLVNHGHRRTREVFRELERPVSLRHGTPDARLLVETALAAGISEIEGGGLSYCLPYSDRYPVERSLLHWQYVDRLCAELSLADRPIHRESFGPLTATLVPPAIVAAVELIELLLAAEQGVRSFSVSFGQTGSAHQDLALAAVLREKCAQSLSRFRFAGVRVYLVYHQWMGAFPTDRGKARALVALSTLLAALMDADKVVIKTEDEAFGLPSVAAGAEAVRLVRYLLERLPPLEIRAAAEVAAEARLIGEEVEEILGAVFDAPGGDFRESVAEALRRGYLDIPFSPHRANPNRVRTARDRRQAIRIADPGRLPLRGELVARERELLGAEGAGASTIDGVLRDIEIMM